MSSLYNENISFKGGQLTYKGQKLDRETILRVMDIIAPQSSIATNRREQATKYFNDLDQYENTRANIANSVSGGFENLLSGKMKREEYEEFSQQQRRELSSLERSIDTAVKNIRSINPLYMKGKDETVSQQVTAVQELQRLLGKELSGDVRYIIPSNDNFKKMLHGEMEQDDLLKKTLAHVEKYGKDNLGYATSDPMAYGGNTAAYKEMALYNAINGKDQPRDIQVDSGDGIRTMTMGTFADKFFSSNGGYATVDDITDDEKKSYNEIAEQYGILVANRYLLDLMPTLKLRSTFKRGKELSDDDSAWGQAEKAATVFVGTASHAMDGIKNKLISLGGGKPVEPSVITQVADQSRVGDTGAENLAHGIVGIAGNMVPALVANAVAPGSGALSGAFPAMATTVSSGGNKYAEAIRAGYSVEEARVYSHIAGALEGGLQYAFNGINILGDKAASKLVSKIPAIQKLQSRIPGLIKNPVMQNTVKNVGKYLSDAGSEAFEEGMQEFLDPVIRNLVLNEDNPIEFMSEEQIDAAILALFSAGLMNAPGTISKVANGVSYGKDINAALSAEGIDRKTLNEIAGPVDWTMPEGYGGAANGRALLEGHVSGDALTQAAGMGARPASDAGQSAVQSAVQPSVLEQYAQNEAPPVEDSAPLELTDDVLRMAQTSGLNVQAGKLDPGVEGHYDPDTRTVTLSETARSPVEFLFKHEMTHSIEGTKAYADLVKHVMNAPDFIRAQDTTGTTFADTVAYMMKERADAGKPIQQDQAVREVVADYVGKRLFTDEAAIRRLVGESRSLGQRILDWIRRVKTFFAGGNLRYIQRAESLYMRALNEASAGGTAGNAGFSIQVDPDIGEYVDIDTDQDIFDGLDYKQARAKAAEIIRERFVGETFGYPNEATASGKTVKEYTHSYKTERLNESVAIDKFRASTELDNLLSTGRLITNDGNQHGEERLTGGTDHYAVTFRVGRELYEGRVIVKNYTDNRLLYDIVNIKSRPLTAGIQDINPMVPTSGGLSDNLSDNDSIPNSDENVNNGMYAVGTGSIMDRLPDLIKRYGAIDPGENPVRAASVPQRMSDTETVNRFVRTGLESGSTPDSMVEPIRQEIADGRFSGEVLHNDDTLAAAREKFDRLQFDDAFDAWNKLMRGNQRLTPTDIAMAELLYDHAANNGMEQRAIDILADLSTVLREAGQVAQAGRILKKLTVDEYGNVQPTGMMKVLQSVVDKANSEIRREKKGREIFRTKDKQALSLSPETVQDVMSQTTQEGLDQAYDRALDALAAQIRPEAKDVVRAWRYTAMLANPRTHLRNVAGNVAMEGVSFAKDLIRAGLEAKAEKSAQKKGVEFERTISAKTMLGGNPETRQYANNYYDVNRDKLFEGMKSKYGETSELMQRVRKLPGFAGATSDFVSKALQAEDMFFQKKSFVRNFAGYLSANHIDPNTATRAQLDRAAQLAVEQALVNTFNNTSALAKALNKFAHNNLGTEIALGSIVPFTKTPINVAKTGVQYSPIGLVNGLTKMGRALNGGNVTVNQAIDSLAKGMTGSMILGLGVLLHSMGVLSVGMGDGDEDDLRKLTGEQGFALNIGGHSYTIDWLSPSAMPLLVGAELHAAFEGDGRKEPLKRVFDGLMQIGDPMIEMSMLQGLNNMLETVSYSDNKLADMVTTMAAGYVTQFVPTVLNQAAGVGDPQRKSVYIDKNSQIPEEVDMLLQKIGMRIPAIRNLAFEPYIDEWGRDQRDDNPFSRFFENTLSPGFASKISVEDMEKELQRLYNETGEGIVIPGRAKKSFKVDGQDVHLSAKEYTQYARVKGVTSKTMLTELVGTQAYRKLSDDLKVKAIEKVYDYANAKAKTVVSSYELSKSEQKIADAVKAGISASQFFTYQTATGEYEADKDADGKAISGSEKEKILSYIDSMELTPKQKDTLYTQHGWSEKEIGKVPWNSGKARMSGSAGYDLYKAAFG